LHRLFIIYSEKSPLGDLGVKDKCDIISLFILISSSIIVIFGKILN